MISFRDLGKMGRLGNQLFQIATTIALAIRNNDSYIFPPWSYENSFNLHHCFSDHIVANTDYREPSFLYSPIPYSPNTNLFGFFQSEKYFNDCRDVIHNLLTPKIGFGIKYGCTSIHVRRGDYLNLTKEYVQQTMSYYMAAMDTIKSEQYLVISDDIPWCKRHFIGNQFVFSEGKSEVEDLALRIASENNIISNSSFSWWGAWLNKNPSKIVVAPAQWFGPGLPHDTKDLLPSNWIKK